jgi:hypothetical protein
VLLLPTATEVFFKSSGPGQKLSIAFLKHPVTSSSVDLLSHIPLSLLNSLSFSSSSANPPYKMHAS